MNKSIFQLVLGLCFLALAYGARATETLRVSGNQSIDVRLESGETMRLDPGAMISVSRSGDFGWAWSVQVLKTSEKASIQTSPTWAKIGKQSLRGYLDNGVLTAPQTQEVERAEEEQSFQIIGEGSVEVLSGDQRAQLLPGDRFEWVDEDASNWKTALIIRSSENSELVGKKVYIGRSYLNQLMETGHIQSPESRDPRPPKPPQKPLGHVRPRARPAEVEMNAQLDCPEFGRYRVEQSFFFDALDESFESEALSIPSGSTIEVIEGEDSKRCHFVLTGTSNPQLSDHIGLELLTYPSNLNEQSLSVHLSQEDEQQARSQGLDFRPGTSFVLNSPGLLSAYNIEEGSSQTVPASFVLNVEQSRAHLIQLRGQNGEHFVVERSDLEQLRSRGEVMFDGPWSLGQTLEEIQDLEAGELHEDCPPGVDAQTDWESEDPIIWESCREQNQVGSNGRRLPANNYYDELIQDLSDFGTPQKQQWLQNPRQRELTKCIKQSLKGGLNRNVRPVCEYNSAGNLEHGPIRRNVTKTNSRGKRYRTQEILNPAPRACASETTSSFLAKSFDRASSCLGLDPRELFDLINHESHFQPGAISPTGALSVGQTVISNYLQIHKSLQQADNLISAGGQRLEEVRRFSDPEVYRQDYENSGRRSQTRYTVFLVSELEDKIKNPSAHGCQDLAHLLENPIQVPSGKDPAQHVLETENRRLCLPHQPGQSFLMAGLDYLANKKYAEALVGNWDENNARSDATKAAHFEDITKILGKWMYNGGQEGMARSFEYFMQELKAGRVTKRDDQLNPVVENGRTQTIQARDLSELSLDDFKKYMSVHIKQRYPGGSARKTEVAGYIQKMDRDVQRLQERGLQCTQ